MISCVSSDALREFAKTINKFGITEILSAYLQSDDRLASQRFDQLFLDEEFRRPLGFLCFGEARPSEELENLFGKRTITTLSELGFLVETGEEIRLNNFRLVCHFGKLLFCDQPSVHARRYYGSDSIALGRLLLSAKGKVLDLCAGTGSQSILCANLSSHVTAVEIERSCETTFHVNTILNGVEDRVKFLCGDLFSTLKDERFDLICCNPPLLPNPLKSSFPFVGDGGGGRIDDCA